MDTNQHLMIDFETLGVNFNAPIIQIGACYFNPQTGRVGPEFERGVDLDSSLKEGFSPDASTIRWWMNQTDIARGSVFNNSLNTVGVREAIGDLTSFMEGALSVWSHATADAVWLTNHQRVLGIPPSVHFTQYKDIRTLTYLAGVNSADFAPVGEAHVALDDCKFQISYCIEAIRVLNKEER